MEGPRGYLTLHCLPSSLLVPVSDNSKVWFSQGYFGKTITGCFKVPLLHWKVRFQIPVALSIPTLVVFLKKFFLLIRPFMIFQLWNKFILILDFFYHYKGNFKKVADISIIVSLKVQIILCFNILGFCLVLFVCLFSYWPVLFLFSPHRFGTLYVSQDTCGGR